MYGKILIFNGGYSREVASRPQGSNAPRGVYFFFNLRALCSVFCCISSLNLVFFLISGPHLGSKWIHVGPKRAQMGPNIVWDKFGPILDPIWARARAQYLHIFAENSRGSTHFSKASYLFWPALLAPIGTCASKSEYFTKFCQPKPSNEIRVTQLSVRKPGDLSKIRMGPFPTNQCILCQ